MLPKFHKGKTGKKCVIGTSQRRKRKKKGVVKTSENIERKERCC
jgi:hypothetical protein